MDIQPDAVIAVGLDTGKAALISMNSTQDSIEGSVHPRGDYTAAWTPVL
jgi:hypothetical protein